MGASVGFVGFDVKLQIEDAGTPGTFIDLEEVLSSSFPDKSREAVDISHSTSPVDAVEVTPGRRDDGEITTELNYVQAGWLLLEAAMALRTKTNFKIVFVDPSFTTTDPEFLVAAVITGLSGPIPADDKVTFTVTIKVSGPAVFTAGTEV